MSLFSVAVQPPVPAQLMGDFPFPTLSSEADWMMTVIAGAGGEGGEKQSAEAHNGIRFWGGNEM